MRTSHWEFAADLGHGHERHLSPDVVAYFTHLRAMGTPCEACGLRPIDVLRGRRGLCRPCATTETVDREIARQRAQFATMRGR